MVAYASLAELKDRLCISDNDRNMALQRCLDGASRWIEKETTRRFYVLAQTRYYTAEHRSWSRPSDISERPGGGAQSIAIDDLLVTLDVDDLPVYPTVATDEDGDGVYEVAWTYGTDFWLGPRNAAADGKPFRYLNRNESVGRYWLPQLENSLSVTGAFGYSQTTPEDIREVTLDAATIMAQPVLDLGLPGVESYSISNQLRVNLKPAELTDYAQKIIMQYRTVL